MPSPLHTVSIRRMAWICALAVLFLFQGCFPKPTAPIRTLHYGRMDATEHKNLLILLRGMGGGIEDFENYGLIQEVRDRKLPFDIAVPDAHYGYYRSETLGERLRQDIILPARQKGYQQVWMAGFSMGGLGSLFFLKYHQEDVDGVLLVSPFMGWEPTLKEISRSGGVRRWTARPESDEWNDVIWGWVQQYARAPEKYPPVYLGYGTNDTIVGKGPELLAEAIPEDRRFTVNGRHDYSTFQLLWRTHLDRLEKEFRALPR